MILRAFNTKIGLFMKIKTPKMSLFITIHDGDVLPLVSQVDNFTHWVERFIRNLQLLLNYYECEDFES